MLIDTQKPRLFAVVSTLLVFGCAELVTLNKVHAQETPQCAGKPATIYVQGGIIVGGPDSGQPYRGMLRGTLGDDIIVGTSGNDIIYGFGGNDTICAGPGDDELYGGAGNDIIEGGPGDDMIRGEEGDDVLKGGPGNDDVDSGPGNDQPEGEGQKERAPD